jgi:zinc transport system substrate-binding protein
MLLGLSGCQSCHAKDTRSERLSVAVSLFPVFDLTRRVAGPDADVHLIVPPGRSEHGYEPTTGDRETLSRSHVIVMVGLELDPWMDSGPRESGSKTRVLKVGDRVPTIDVPGTESTDPHVWLDPARARLIVRAIAEELGKADAAHAIAYRQRATSVDESLAALDREIETRTKAIAERGMRGVAPQHKAFSYFAERYKLPIGDVVGSTPGSLDPLGGTAATDTYEKLIRYDTAALETSLK